MVADNLNMSVNVKNKSGRERGNRRAPAWVVLLLGAIAAAVWVAGGEEISFQLSGILSRDHPSTPEIRTSYVSADKKTGALTVRDRTTIKADETTTAYRLTRVTYTQPLDVTTFYISVEEWDGTEYVVITGAAAARVAGAVWTDPPSLASAAGYPSAMQHSFADPRAVHVYPLYCIAAATALGWIVQRVRIAMARRGWERKKTASN
jgi:ribosomal protein L39E